MEQVIVKVCGKTQQSALQVLTHRFPNVKMASTAVILQEYIKGRNLFLKINSISIKMRRSYFIVACWGYELTAE
jgi:hypothetical protein